MKKFILVSLCALMAGSSIQAMDYKKFIARFRTVTPFGVAGFFAGIGGCVWGYGLGRKSMTALYRPQLTEKEKKLENVRSKISELTKNHCRSCESEWATYLHNNKSEIGYEQKQYELWKKWNACKDSSPYSDLQKLAHERK